MKLANTHKVHLLCSIYTMEATERTMLAEIVKKLPKIFITGYNPQRSLLQALELNIEYFFHVLQLFLPQFCIILGAGIQVEVVLLHECIEERFGVLDDDFLEL